MTRIEEVEEFCSVKFDFEVYPKFSHDVCAFGKIINLRFGFDDFDKDEILEAVQVSLLKDF